MPTYECPTCRRTFEVARQKDAPFRPFCCRRCKLVDLGRWFDGTYTISEPLPDQAESPPPAPVEHDDSEPGAE